MNLLLTLRRVRRDAGLLLVWTALLAFTVMLVIAGPRQLLRTVDSGAREAVATAGAATDVLVSAEVGTNRDDAAVPIPASRIQSVAAAIPGRLPVGVRTVLRDSTLTVLGPSTQVSTVNGAATKTGSSPIAVRVALLTAANRPGLRLTSGVLPTAVSASDTLDVVLSAASASAAGLTVGDAMTVGVIPVSSAITGSRHLTLRVVGIVDEATGLGPSASPWSDTPELWAPVVPPSGAGAAPLQVTVLTDEGGIQTAAARYSSAVKATLRLRLDPHRFTAARLAQVGSELVSLAASDTRLGGPAGDQLSVSTQYGSSLDAFPGRERASVAQISLVVAGVLGVAAAVLLLVSRLIVARRQAEVALERARGASLRAIAQRALVESLLESIVGLSIGLGVVDLLIPGTVFDVALLALVLVLAVAAVPVQTIVAVRALWAGTRTPANLRDRIELLRRARARRIAIELTLLLLATAAVLAITGRGLLETRTSGIDPLLAAAPLLVAVAVTIVILRVYPFPVRVAIRAGRRSVGALGLLAAVRAQRSIAALPLAALTLAVALAVGSGLLAGSVAAGQDTASWQRIGADVRARGDVTAAAESRIADAPGITDEATLTVLNGVQLRLAAGTDFATVLGIDSHFPRLVAALPAGGTTEVGSLRTLLSHPAAGGELPVVVDRAIAAELDGSRQIGLYVGVTFVEARVVGVTDESPNGYLTAPFVYAERSALAGALHTSVRGNLLLANGPGARSAIGAALPGASIITRARWLAERRHLALVRGVSETISAAAVAIAILAVLALVVTVIGGSSERGRSLSLVRTLGLPARLGWWLALAELTPTILAALIGGVLAGVGTILVLEPVLGVQQLAGGLTEPPPVISTVAILGLVGGAILLLCAAVLIEVIVRRRDRLSEVLRVGETV